MNMEKHMDKILPVLIGEYAQAEPGRLFAADPAGSVTYKEAWEAISRGAALLRELGIRPGERILVDCTQDRFFLLAHLACQLSGAVSVPLEANVKEDTLKRILSDTGAVMRITKTGTEDTVWILTQQELIGTLSGTVPEGKADRTGKGSLLTPGRTAEILFTTGTTGTSKGIALTHANNLALAENIISGTGMRRYNVELVPLPLSHSHGLRTCYAAFLQHGGVVITDGVSRVKEIYDLIKKYQVTALDLSPTAASVLLKLSRGAFREFNGQLDYIEIGTAALSEELKSELIRQFPEVRLYNFYGSTESGRSCALNFNSPDDQAHCIGYPTKNAHFLIVDENGCEIASGANRTGLLACKGPMNMKGYWNAPALTESVLRDGVLYTQDEGYLDEKGRVFCLGRKDDVINFRGIKIAPDEIEEKAAGFAGVKDCALVGLEDPSAGQIPVLCYAEVSGSVDQDAFFRYLEERIAKEYLPKRLVVCAEIPRTASGKLRRKALKEELRNNGGAEA